MTLPYFLTIDQTDDLPEVCLSRHGNIFARFDERTQDSGNISYGLKTADATLFIKTAGSPSAKAFLSHADRIYWLRNAITFARTFASPILSALRNVIETPNGPMLVYDWLDAELLGCPAPDRTDPTSAFMRFKQMPLEPIANALDQIFRFHTEVCRQGWVSNDFYDRAVMYHFGNHHTYLMDLDMYRPGPFANDMGRLFGSSRFMAPEEFTKGATITEQTTVFTMGRCIQVLVADAQVPAKWFDVANKACQNDPGDRFPSMNAFYAEWRTAAAT